MSDAEYAEAVDDFLRDVRTNLDQLDIAPPLATDTIQRRMEDDRHDCRRCGQPAMLAYVTLTKPPRWLDLCAPCAHWLRVGIELPRPDADDVLLELF